MKLDDLTKHIKGADWSIALAFARRALVRSTGKLFDNARTRGLSARTGVYLQDARA